MLGILSRFFKPIELFPDEEELKGVVEVTAGQFREKAKAAGIRSRAIDALLQDSEFLGRPVLIGKERLVVTNRVEE